MTAFRQQLLFGIALLFLASTIGAQVTTPESLANLGKTYQDLGDYAKAHEYYSRRLELAPDDGAALFDVAVSEYWIEVAGRISRAMMPAARRQRVDTSLQNLDKLFARYPNYPNAMFYEFQLYTEKAKDATDEKEKEALNSKGREWLQRGLEAAMKPFDQRRGPVGVRSPAPTLAVPNDIPKGTVLPPDVATIMLMPTEVPREIVRVIPSNPAPAVSPQTEPFPPANPQLPSVPALTAQANVSFQRPPIYPDAAKRARVQGAVVLTAAITKEGTVEGLTVISGDPMLRQAAIDAVKQWRYKPFLLNGQPSEVQTTVTVNFAFSN